MAQLMPLPPTVSCFSKIQIGFTFLVPAHPGSPGQRAVKRLCVCVCVCVCVQAKLVEHKRDERESPIGARTSQRDSRLLVHQHVPPGFQVASIPEKSQSHQGTEFKVRSKLCCICDFLKIIFVTLFSFFSYPLASRLTCIVILGPVLSIVFVIFCHFNTESGSTVVITVKCFQITIWWCSQY